MKNRVAPIENEMPSAGRLDARRPVVLDCSIFSRKTLSSSGQFSKAFSRPRLRPAESFIRHVVIVPDRRPYRRCESVHTG